MRKRFEECCLSVVEKDGAHYLQGQALWVDWSGIAVLSCDCHVMYAYMLLFYLSVLRDLVPSGM